MSIWYINSYMENIINITNWLSGGKRLCTYPLLEKLIDDQKIREDVY